MQQQKKYSYSVNQLRRNYKVAFLIIVLALIASLAVMINLIESNEQSAYLVNKSGRQRMLSQRASMLSLSLAFNNDAETNTALQEELSATISTMQAKHNELAVVAEKTPAYRHIFFCRTCKFG